MIREYKKLEDAYEKYISAKGAMEAVIADKVEMDDFSVFHQQGDGLVLEYDDFNAPLDTCIEIIKKKGRLSLEDYMDNTI